MGEHKFEWMFLSPLTRIDLTFFTSYSLFVSTWFELSMIHLLSTFLLFGFHMCLCLSFAFLCAFSFALLFAFSSSALVCLKLSLSSCLWSIHSNLALLHFTCVLPAAASLFYLMHIYWPRNQRMKNKRRRKEREQPHHLSDVSFVWRNKERKRRRRITEKGQREEKREKREIQLKRMLHLLIPFVSLRTHLLSLYLYPFSSRLIKEGITAKKAREQRIHKKGKFLLSHVPVVLLKYTQV